MSSASRLSMLRFVLILVGLIFIIGVYPRMTALLPSGWRWQPNQPKYEQMVLGVYAAPGVSLVIALRDPLKHRSLIWFTVWSSLVHGGIMAVQALNMPAERGHLFADVPALLIAASVLAVLTPRGEAAKKSNECRIAEKWASGLTFRIFGDGEALR